MAGECVWVARSHHHIILTCTLERMLRMHRKRVVPPTFRLPAECHQPRLPGDWGQIRDPRKARLTGVGLFDRVHDQIGVAITNGIELHPVLAFEWLS